MKRRIKFRTMEGEEREENYIIRFDWSEFLFKVGNLEDYNFFIDERGHLCAEWRHLKK